MNTLKRVLSNKAFIIFIFLHIALFNINFAEWGDSYRILRASEYIRDFSYPSDEKRVPLYSFILALRPEVVDQIFWARTIMLTLSVMTFAVFSKLLDLYKLSQKEKKVALLIFTLNPVFLYWSIRVMADVPFTFLVILAFYIVKLYEKRELNLWYLFIVGIIAGLAVLTRFEGYILGLSLGLGLIVKWKKRSFKIDLTAPRKVLVYGLGAFLVLLPWMVYRNPFTSSYFEESSGRVYDLTTVLIYLVSLLYLFGFTSAAYFIFSQKKKLKQFIKDDFGLFSFILLELILVLVWPAAIPRIFTPVIPFLIIPLAIGIVQFFEMKDTIVSKIAKKSSYHYMLWPILLTIVFLGSQPFLRLQFLIVNRVYFASIVIFQVIILYAIYKKRLGFFMLSLIFSMFVWSLSTIMMHKDIFKPIVLANKFVLENLEGTVAYNDVSSVSDWYLNQKSGEDAVKGIYLNMDDKNGRDFNKLKRSEIDYIILTNEHNLSLEFNPDELVYLEQMKEFRYTIKDKEFFAKVLKFNKEL